MVVEENVSKQQRHTDQHDVGHAGAHDSRPSSCYASGKVIVEAKLHDESTMIQRCFDDNNDDNKR